MGILRNRRVAWLATCVVAWAACVPFLGPVAALAGVAIPALLFSPQFANAEFAVRNRSAKKVRHAWSWRQLLSPENCLVAFLTVGLTLASGYFAQGFPPSVRLTGTGLAGLSCAATVAFGGWRPSLPESAAEPPAGRGPDQVRTLYVLGATLYAGLLSWFLRRALLPELYGELVPGPRQRPVFGAYLWFDRQVQGSLFGPSFEQWYWALLVAAAGLVAGVFAVTVREATSRTAAHNPFAADEPGTGGKVFLSYSRRDTEFARELTDALSGHVREMWVDWQAIKPSEKWRKSIADGIRECDAMVVLISRSSLASPYCWDEVRQAIEQRKRILPVVIEPELASGTTAALREAGWDELTEFQRLDMSKPDRFAEDVRRVVAFTAQEHRWVAGHTRLGLQVHEWLESGRSDGFLLRADELRSAEWLRDYTPGDPAFGAELADREIEFISASRQALRRRRVRLRTAVTGVLIALSGLSSLVVAVQSRAEADRYAALSRSLAVAASKESGARLEESALLAAAAYTESDTPEARNAMADRLFRFNHVVRTLPGPAAVQSFEFSADGSVLAVELANHTTQVWASDGWQLRGTLAGSLPYPADHGLSADGGAVALRDGERIRVTDTRTMRTTATFDLLEHSPQNYWTGGLSADGRTLVGAGTWLAQIFSVPQQKEISQRYCGFLRLSPSGRAMWCRQRNEKNQDESWLRYAQAPTAETDVQIAGAPTLYGWTAADEPVVDDAGTAKVLPADGKGDPWIPQQGMAVWAGGVSDDGSRLLLRALDGRPSSIWDLQTHAKLGDVDGNNVKGVRGPGTDEQLADLVDTELTYGMRLVTGLDNDPSVRPISSDPETLGAHIAFTRDGRKAAARTESHGLAVWERDGRGSLVSTFPVGGLDAPHLYSAISPDGGNVAVVDGGVVRLYTARTGLAVGQVIKLATTGHEVAYSHDGTQLAVSETAATGESSVELFAMPAGLRKAVFRSPAHTDPREWPVGVVFAPDDRRLYFGLSQAMAVFAWDLATGQVTQRYDTGGAYLDGMSLSPDGRFLLTVDRGFRLQQWDTATAKPNWSLEKSAARTVAFGPDGGTLAAASPDLRSLLVWDARTHQRLGADLDVGGQIRAVRLAANGTAIVTLDPGAEEGAVQLWDLAHHTRIGPDLAHVRVGSVAQLTADGSRAIAVAPGQVVSAVIDPNAWKATLCTLAGRQLSRQDWITVAPKQRYIPAC